MFPDQPISTPLGREFRIGDPYYNFTPVLNYGITRWSQLFTKRQLVGLAEMSGLILSSASQRPPLARLLAMSFDRVLMSDMSLTRWNPSGEKMQHTFGRQALPMVWDFAEIVPTAEAPGNWRSGFEIVLDVAARSPRSSPGQVQVHQADAREALLPDGTASIFFTDSTLL